MRRTKVGVLVGHYGRGTGACYGNRDEFELCRGVANRLAARLVEDGAVDPVVICIDREAHPWDLVDRVTGMRSGVKLLRRRLADIDLRFEWGKREGIDGALELHLNSFPRGDEMGVGGVEVWRARCAGEAGKDLAECVYNEVSRALPGVRRRGIKAKGYRILRRFESECGIPAVIVEPGFIWERHVFPGSDEYVGGLVRGISRHFGR